MSGSAANNKRDGDEPAVTDNGLWLGQCGWDDGGILQTMCEHGDFNTQSGQFHRDNIIFCLFTNGFWGFKFGAPISGPFQMFQ